MQWLAGMTMTADRLNDNTVDAVTSSGLTAGTDFTVNSFSGRKVNGVTTVHVYLSYTGAGVTQTNTNIADITIATLPAGWRPPEVINAIVGNGIWIGECTIGTTGVITLRAISYNLTTTNPNTRLTASWISENG